MMTHRAILEGEERYCNQDNYQVVCDELIQKHGGGIPKLELLRNHQAVDEEKGSATAAPLQPATNVIDMRPVAALLNKARAESDRATALEQGFAAAPTLFERGTAVTSLGVDNAKRSRLEHDKKPLVTEYCREFVARIDAEKRSDLPAIRTSSLRMSAEGTIVLPDGNEVLSIEPRALQGVIGRIGCGGASYLEKCPPRLRAININNQAQYLAEREAAAESAKPDTKHSLTVMRTRLSGAGRAAYAAVSDSYAPFDVDKIAEALRLAVPEDARGTVVYDGTRARFEVVFHSDIQPKDYVCGEFFKAAVIIRSNDTGGGGINGSAALFQNLCLNLIIIDQAKKPVFNIRHVGSVAELARKFKAGFQDALAAIGPFIKAWGYAVHENVQERSKVVATDDIPIPIEEALPGFFNALLERELVPVRVGAREGRKQAIADLTAMYQKDESAATRPEYVTRAGIVNAITRYAHEVNQDPWLEDELQSAAGALLVGTRGKEPGPLPYVPFE